jgi:hypothetical protein
VGFDPTIPASERAKTEHALARSATVIGTAQILRAIFSEENIDSGRPVIDNRRASIESITEEERTYVYFMQKDATVHTDKYLINVSNEAYEDYARISHQD